jgi:hypothetical protein
MFELQYPVESGFYPAQFITTSIMSSIFGLLLFARTRFEKIRSANKDGRKPDNIPSEQNRNASGNHNQNNEDKPLSTTVRDSLPFLNFLPNAIQNTANQIVDNFSKISGKLAKPIIEDIANKTREAKSEPGPSLGDLISISGVIITIITFIIGSYIQIPLLDYSVIWVDGKGDSNNERIQISITNYAVTPAKNLLVSLNSNNNFSYSDFVIKPFFPDNLINHSNTDQKNNWYIFIESIPVGSTTDIFLTLTLNSNNSSDKDPKVVTFVRSDETVGLFNTKSIILYYVILGIFYGISSILFWFYKPLRKVIVVISIILLAIMVFVEYFMYNREFHSS